MKQLYKSILAIILISASLQAKANDGPEANNTITSVGIAARVAKHYLGFTNFKTIGSCWWWRCDGPYCKTYPTLEVDEYLPDLVVSVYNGEGNNPWTEARTTLDKASHSIGGEAIQYITGDPLGNGRSGIEVGSRDGDLKTKSVDVIGNPNTLWHFPYVSLKPDTTAFTPYYQSDLDISGRMGIPELIQPETYNPLAYFVGSGITSHWGYEFPRDTTVPQTNDYKASLMVALRAADLVTNSSPLHVINSTGNSCGINCAVSNVIEEQGHDHAIWQMVYPDEDEYANDTSDPEIHIGEGDVTSTDALGRKEDKEGNGNYVFVVWRHYRGCIQGDNYIGATESIPPTTRR